MNTMFKIFSLIPIFALFVVFQNCADQNMVFEEQQNFIIQNPHLQGFVEPLKTNKANNVSTFVISKDTAMVLRANITYLTTDQIERISHYQWTYSENSNQVDEEFETDMMDVPIDKVLDTHEGTYNGFAVLADGETIPLGKVIIDVQ